MSELVRLSQGVFITFTGTHFQIGHIDACYHVHEIRREFLHLLSTFAEASDPDQVLARLKVNDDVRAAIAEFFKKLRAVGILEPAVAGPEFAGPRAQASPKKIVFEIARTAELHSDIGRVYPDFRAAWQRVESLTLTSMPLGLALWNACRYITAAQVPGAVVECGIFRGGSMLLAALALLHYATADENSTCTISSTGRGRRPPARTASSCLTKSRAR